MCTCVPVQTGREKKALKVLRRVHRLNHLHKGEDVQFSIKGVRVMTGQDNKQHVANKTGCGRRQARFYEMIKQVRGGVVGYEGVAEELD